MPYLDNFNVSGSVLKIRDLEAQESITKIAESINSSVGNSNKPIFLDKGNFKECNDILNVNISGNANSATEANHALTADSATEANHATKADSATEANHASTADSATEANHANSATEANHALTADNATEANHALTADSATEANHALTANSATEANHALTADSATEANHANSATEANHALTADSATNSGYSNNSGMLNGHDSNYFSPSTHKHDDRYYTMNQINNLLNGKVDTTSLETTSTFSGLTKRIDANNKRQLRVNSDSSITYALLVNGNWIGRTIFSVITVRANSVQGVTINAPNVDGYTFVAWIGVASNGFVGSPYIESCVNSTTHIFDAHVTGGQSYNAYALYSILK